MGSPFQLRITALALGMAVLSPAWAETPAQVQQRLEQYRQQDEAAAQRRALQAVEAAQRRERTLQWQEQRRREEYARRWKCYGAKEIDGLLWRQQKDGTWVTSAKDATGAVACASDKPPGGEEPGTRPRFQSLVAGDRLWVKVRASISIAELASALAQDETRLARLNDVDEDHNFQAGDWLVLPSQSSRQAKQLASIDTSEMRRTPPLDSAQVRFGDTLAKIALRYNVTIMELLSLNPGLQGDRLVAGKWIQVARSTPDRSRMILGLAPSASGGLRWPDQSLFQSGGTGPTFSADQLIGVNCISLMVNRKPPF